LHFMAGRRRKPPQPSGCKHLFMGPREARGPAVTCLGPVRSPP
jgi:hypothetical protein